VKTRDPETGKRAGSPYFRRTFLSEDTSEIRLYTMGGADRILVDGVADQTIRVRVVAPPKTVEVSDRSSQPSAIHVYAPLKDPPPSASALEASASPLPTRSRTRRLRTTTRPFATGGATRSSILSCRTTGTGGS